MNATMKGCEMVWSCPIGSGSIRVACIARMRSGTNSSRGTLRIAASTRSDRAIPRTDDLLLHHPLALVRKIGSRRLRLPSNRPRRRSVETIHPPLPKFVARHKIVQNF